VELRLLRIILALTLLLLANGCKHRAAPPSESVPLPVITDATTDTLFTWIDDGGEFHVEQKVGDVPAAAREVVRVTDPAKDPPKLDDVFVVDLRTPGEGGSYPVRTMSRPEFEKIAVDRRQQHGKILTAQGASSVAPAATASVIIYGASWCGPCHQAADYLKRRGVQFVQKDIEADSSAQREMQAKLTNAGMRGGSIPVIDVRGKLLIGFDQGAIDRALGKAL
jgi:glutaredoxin